MTQLPRYWTFVNFMDAETICHMTICRKYIQSRYISHDYIGIICWTFSEYIPALTEDSLMFDSLIVVFIFLDISVHLDHRSYKMCDSDDVLSTRHQPTLH